jgi:hypothetical protein
MGRPTIIDPGEGGGGGSSGGIIIPQSGGVDLRGFVELTAQGISLTTYPEQKRLTFGAAPATIPMSLPVAALPWAAMPAALTEFLGLTVGRLKADLTLYREARLIVNVQAAGFAGASLRVQSSTDLAAWAYLDGSGAPSSAVDATGMIDSGWVAMAAASLADVYLRLVGINGNGVATPTFGAITLQVR